MIEDVKMKKIILFLVLFYSVCYAQENFWEQTNGPANDSILILTVSVNDDIYAGTKDGIFRSTDQGTNWIIVSDSIARSIVTNNSGYIYLASINGLIYRSTDDGSKLGIGE